MTINLCGKRALITGGTGSVGRVLVEHFSASGASVTFQYKTNDIGAIELAKRCRADTIQCDLVQLGTFPQGHFDIVINNAGINVSGAETGCLPFATYRETLAVNLDAAFLITQQYLAGMVQRRWGRIVNISSIYGLIGSPNNCSYNISKHGLSGLTKTVAKEYAKDGITCNEICPGPIDSALMHSIAARKAALSGKTAQSYLDDIALSIPAQRLANPSDIAQCAVFLSSDMASYINGASIVIDGGLTC